jgi:ankyrin repeat protein
MDETNDKRLLTALVKSHAQVVKERNRMNARTFECCCCCTCLCCVRKEDLLDPYADHKYNLSDLMQACMSRDIYLMLDILYHPKYPIDVNSITKEGDTALYRVLMESMQNEFEGVEEENDATNLFSPSPWWVPGIWRKKPKRIVGKIEWVLKILLYSGAGLDYVSSNTTHESGTLLHGAVERNLPHMVSWLIEKGCDPNVRTTMLRRTALMLACLKDCPDIALYLLTKGAMTVLNEQDTRGWSALHFAAAFSQPNVVKALLIAGANKAMLNNEGRDAMEEARSRHMFDNMNVIIAHNPNERKKESLDRLEHLTVAYGVL